jgi:hypothetical protein
MSDSARQAEAWMQAEEMKRVIAKCMDFYAPAAKKLLAECLYGRDVVSAALRSVSAKRHPPSVKVLAGGSHIAIGQLSGDGTLRELLPAGILWKEWYKPPPLFNLCGLRDGKYYLLPYNVPLTELPDEVFLVAVKTKDDSKQHMLAAVEQDGMAIKYASDDLKADHEIVLAAVKQDGWALEFASKELRADRVIVLAAVKHVSWALQYASKELRADREIVIVALKYDGWALQYASKELMADPEIRAAAGWS